ncbi:unnamed protein product [Darwinula stevensoni]|uniref:Hflx-type G domain-containing protein n=1 Tax=Darwinula stevensoni TaxID=69355 RepID=A0A7R9AGS4_9CRUS|nr:unnamed protein product [Darwinula stevensoni]CAG0904382.1 unnamed protein product [Darwinula stevensoni]
MTHGVYRVDIHNTANFDAQLQELGLLAQTAGYTISGALVCKRPAPDAKFFVGSGKAQEIKDLMQETGANEVLFDQALSPVQQRNLERFLECPVNDRTMLILQIFSQRARSHEGKLQVQLAQLQYAATRLVRRWSHLERQSGGIGLRGGPGETQMELDKRMITQSIVRTKERLKKIERQQNVQRRQRGKTQATTVALVGYTNAGKSTLFNALVKAQSYAADQLFATLDTTTRQWFIPETGEKIMLSDTVGFIRELPHGLIAAFKATLQEAVHADVLLHVVDRANPDFMEQMEQVQQVLHEIGAADIDQIVVFNKCDVLKKSEIPPSCVGTWAVEGKMLPSVYVSAMHNQGMAELRILVDAGYQGVVTQFGKYQKSVGEGLHWRLPWPVQRNEQVDLRLQKLDVGTDAIVPATGLPDSAMLTKDENIVEIKLAVQWQVKDPRSYLYNVSEPVPTVVKAAETAVREVVGNMTMEDVIQGERDQIPGRVRDIMQNLLDSYQIGINVQGVNLQQSGVRPPDQVQAAFDDVLKAGQEKSRSTNEAQAYANNVVPLAKGTASRLLQEADGYAARVVAQAQGDAARFDSIYEEYKKAPKVTRDRMYTDTMKDVYTKVTKVLVDSKQGSNLLYLPLDKLLQQNLDSAKAAQTQNSAGSTNGSGANNGSAAESKPATGASESVTVTIPADSRTHQRQFGVVQEFGEIKRVITEPGLKAKVPFIQDNSYLDKRLLLLTSGNQGADSEPTLTAEKQRVVIDWYVRWNITNPQDYIRNLGTTTEAGAEQLRRVVRNSFQQQVNKLTLQQILSSQREQLMTDVKKQVSSTIADSSKPWGLQVQDVRISRVDYSKAVIGSVFDRMTAERKRAANELRSTGQADGESIRADADKQREVTLSQAYEQAQTTKGKADAQATQIYAKAFGKDPQFAQFYRNLEAYKASFQSKDDVLVLDPDSSEFLRIMKGSGAGK